jgi:hypothetical protein
VAVRIKAVRLESLQKNLPRLRRILKKAPDKDDQDGLNGLIVWKVQTGPKSQKD